MGFVARPASEQIPMAGRRNTDEAVEQIPTVGRRNTNEGQIPMGLEKTISLIKHLHGIWDNCHQNDTWKFDFDDRKNDSLDNGHVLRAGCSLSAILALQS